MPLSDDTQVFWNPAMEHKLRDIAELVNVENMADNGTMLSVLQDSVKYQASIIGALRKQIENQTNTIGELREKLHFWEEKFSISPPYRTPTPGSTGQYLPCTLVPPQSSTPTGITRSINAAMPSPPPNPNAPYLAPLNHPMQSVACSSIPSPSPHIATLSATAAPFPLAWLPSSTGAIAVSTWNLDRIPTSSLSVSLPTNTSPSISPNDITDNGVSQSTQLRAMTAVERKRKERARKKALRDNRIMVESATSPGNHCHCQHYINLPLRACPCIGRTRI